MDERETSTAPAQIEPTTALPTAENLHPKRVKKRGPAGAFIVLAVIAVLGILAVVLALVFAQKSSSQSFVGEWGAGIQSLEIAADGQARGTDGCNDHSSSWSQSGNKIIFEGFVGTKMACMGPGGKLLNGWLGQATSALLDPAHPNLLIFFDQNDSRLGSMVRNGAVEPLPQQPVVPTGEPYLPGLIGPTPDHADGRDALTGP